MEGAFRAQGLRLMGRQRGHCVTGRNMQELSHTMEDMEVFPVLTSEEESNPDEDRGQPVTAVCPGMHRAQDPKVRGRSC